MTGGRPRDRGNNRPYDDDDRRGRQDPFGRPGAREPAPGSFAEVVDGRRRFGVLPGHGCRSGRVGGSGGRCRRRPRTRLPRSPCRPSEGSRKKEDGARADFVPAGGDRFGCPEPSGTEGAGSSKALADLCASYAPPERVTPRSAPAVVGRSRSVQDRGLNPHCRESAQRMPKRATAGRGSAQLLGARHAFGAGVSDSPRDRRTLIGAVPAHAVKKSPTSSGRACTVSCSRDTSSQVNAVIDWLRRPRTCFDPSHRRVIAVSRKRVPGARARGRHLSPEGAAPPL